MSALFPKKRRNQESAKESEGRRPWCPLVGNRDEWGSLFREGRFQSSAGLSPLRTIICVSRAILVSICDVGAGAGDGGAGFRADGDAVRDSRAGSWGPYTGGAFANGGGTRGVWAGIAG